MIRGLDLSFETQHFDEILWLVVYEPLTTMGNQETILQDCLVILKRLLKNN